MSTAAPEDPPPSDKGGHPREAKAGENGPAQGSPDPAPDAERDLLSERNRVLLALLESAAEIASGADSDTIIGHMCEALVAATARLRLAWFWFGDPATPEMRPMIFAGPARAYAENLVIPRNLVTERGAAFRALLTDEPDSTRITSSTALLFAPWREAAGKHNLKASVALPIRVPESAQRGIVVFYCDQAGYFDRLGLEPFLAFARLAEAALAQADLRRRLRVQATTDALTGILNREGMRPPLQYALSMANRHRQPFALLLADIDHFKRVNDSHGHANGDRALAHCARLMRASLRQEDLICRWGGEEFLILLPLTSAAAAARVAERIREHVGSHPLSVAGRQVNLTISIGGGAYPDHGMDVSTLLKATDAALYAAKHAGRNQVVMAAT